MLEARRVVLLHGMHVMQVGSNRDVGDCRYREMVQ